MLKVYLNTFWLYFILGTKFSIKIGLLNSILISVKYLIVRLQFRLRFVRVKFIPPNVYLMMTKRCNLDCSFCHYVGELNKVGEVDDEHEISLDDLLGFERKGILKSPSKVCLYGGEPMLNKSFFEIVDYLNNNSYVSSTITNGTFLKKYLDKLTENPLHQITISYYQGIANHLEDEIRTLSELSIINISIIISDESLLQLESVINFAIRVKAKFITIENIIEKNGCSRKAIFSSKDYNEFKKKLLSDYSSKIILRWSEVHKNMQGSNPKINCSEPWDMILIDKKSRVLPCCQYPLEAFSDPMTETSDIFNTPDLLRIRSQMKNGVAPSKCIGCHYLYAKDPLYTY